MQYRTLGRTGLSVSRLCFGTLTMSPLQKDMSAEEGAELLVYAYERGVRFLDTADLYGTYPHIRLALKQAPDYVVSTKAYCYDEKTAQEALERAFHGIDREYVDIFMLHEQESYHTLRGHRPALEYLLKQKELGRIGALGVSTHFVAAVKASLRFPEIEIVHPLINAAGIGIQDGSRDDMEIAIADAHANGRGIFAMKPLGGGHLIHSSQEAFDYILNAPWADSVAVGMQSFAEIDANIARFEEAENASALLEPLSRRERHMMVHDWCEACGKCAERCRQQAIEIADGRARIDESKCVFCGYCARVCPQFCIKVV